MDQSVNQDRNKKEDVGVILEHLGHILGEGDVGPFCMNILSPGAHNCVLYCPDIVWEICSISQLKVISEKDIDLCASLDGYNTLEAKLEQPVSKQADIN